MIDETKEIIEVTAGIIPNKDGKILIAQRKGGHLDKKWEFPGGTFEASDKSYEGCLYRELKEELGIETRIGFLFEEVVHDYLWKGIKLKCYWVEYVYGEIVPKVHSEIKWIYPNELKNYDFAEADLSSVNKLRNLNR